ncbi:MAG: FG-GAP-like repeat-containing protein [Pyrinomonadaceae bacterium]|nr:FG-GAP-like repeat-containing protein [Pyrinomonadaceae bacterium]
MKENRKSLFFAMLVVAVSAFCLWYFAETKTQAQSEPSDTSEVVTSPAPAGTFTGSGVGTIPDNTGTSCGNYASATPLNITFNVTGLSGSVVRAEVQFNVSPAHTWRGDLRAILLAPGGSPSHILFSQTGAISATGCGSSTDLFGIYRFADSPPATNWWSVTAATTTPGTYQATQPAPQTASTFSPTTSINAAFTSVTNPNGTWTLQFLDGAPGDTGGISGATLEIETAAATKPCFDFYGTGRTSFGIVNNEGGVIVWRTRANGGTGSENIGYGLTASDFITPGYYDTDNRADIAVWRSGTYYIRRSTTGNPTDIFPVPWGISSDFPVREADYDGDGRDDLTVVRAVSSVYVWYILRSSTNTFSAVSFGNPTLDVPIAGADYNGDGRADITVIRDNPGAPDTYYVGDASTGNIILVQNWGNYATDFYVVGDYIGDSRADFAVWRGFGSGTDGRWYILENGGPGTVVTQFGIPGASTVRDQPICGDYDGNGKSDIAVYRPSNKTFYWLTTPSNPSSNQQFTITFPTGTAPISGELAIGAFRAF